MNMMKTIAGAFGKNQWIGLTIYGCTIAVACIGTYTSSAAQLALNAAGD